MLCSICCFCFQRNPSFSLCSSGVVYVMLHLLFLFSEEYFLQSMLIWCCIILCSICCFCFQRNPSFSLCSSGVVYVMLNLLFSFSEESFFQSMLIGVVYVMLNLLFLFSEDAFLQSMLIWCCICYVTFVVFVFRGILPSVYAHLVLYMLRYICCFCFQRKPSCSLCSSGVVYVTLHLLFLFSEEAFLRCPAYLQSMLICLQAIEQNKVALLADINPSLVNLSASTWQDGSNGGVANKLHERDVAP